MQDLTVDEDVFDIDPLTTEDLAVPGSEPKTETNTFTRKTETNT